MVWAGMRPGHPRFAVIPRQCKPQPCCGVTAGGRSCFPMLANRIVVCAGVALVVVVAVDAIRTPHQRSAETPTTTAPRFGGDRRVAGEGPTVPGGYPCDRPGPYVAVAAIGPYTARRGGLSRTEIGC